MLPANRLGGRSARRGAAAVEFAACLPLLCLLIFGSLQACNLLFLKNALTTAAYEATLEVCKADATRESVAERAENILSVYGVKQGSVSISPSKSLSDIAVGTEITISVTAPTSINVPGPEIIVPSDNVSSFGVTVR